MKERKTFSNWLTTKYLLIIRNEEDFAEKRNYQFTYAKAVAIGFSIFLVILALSTLMVNTFLARWFDPSYAKRQLKKELVELTVKVDSLESQNEVLDNYIYTFKTMLTGGVESASINSETSEENLENVDIDYKAPIDAKIRKEFEGEEFDVNLVSDNSYENVLHLHLFKPIDGVVVEEYSSEKEHYAVDIVAKKDEPVKSVAAGTVIMSTWTDDTGHVIGVQHENNLISFYKHNAVLLKKIGDFVQAGDILAIIGNSGKLTTGPHLHFELWYNGVPINPKNYISL